MKKILLTLSLLVLFVSCNKESKNIKEEKSLTVKLDEETNSLDITKASKTVKDNFVGKWKNISVEDEIVEVTKKYDNVYLLGNNGLVANKMYAEDGTVYLQGDFDEQIEFQLIFDEHTQHLIMRHPFDVREYARIE